MKIFKTIRVFFLKWSRTSNIMQNVIFHVKVLSLTLIPDVSRSNVCTAIDPMANQFFEMCLWSLRRILIDVQAIIEKSDISLIGSVVLTVPEKILKEASDCQALSEDHQLFLVTLKTGCKVRVYPEKY